MILNRAVAVGLAVAGRLGKTMLMVFAAQAALATMAAADAPCEKATPFAVKGCAVVLAKEFAATKGEAWARDAANDLARVLSKVTGEEIEVRGQRSEVRGSRSEDEKIIYLGLLSDESQPSTHPTLQPSNPPISPCEFRIRVTSRRVELLGRTETAVSYAVTEFLERFCGYRFLSQNGEDPYETNPNLTIPACDFTKRPAIAYREVYRCGIRDWLGEKYLPKTAANFFRFARQRRLRVREADIVPDHRVRRIGGSGCHNAFRYLPVKTYFPSHPDWYSMDGKGNRINIENAGGQLCYSNPAVRDEFAKNLLAMIEDDKAKAKGKGERRRPFVYDIGQGVCSTALCLCPNCLGFAARYNRVPGGHGEGGDGALQLDFANDMIRRVRARHPEIRLSICAYLSSEECPEALAAEPGVVAWVNDLFSISDHMVPLTHPINAKKLKSLTDWAKKCEYVKVWDYMMYGTVPEVNADAIAADAKLYRSLGINDVFMETEFHHQPFYDLHMYLMGELYFDPDRDVGELIGDWCRVFGRAAPKMREVIDLLRRWEREQVPATLEDWHNRHLPWHTAENFERLRAMLLVAYAQDETPSVRQRVASVLAGTDGWLVRHYRRILGEETREKARRAEMIRMTKEWATHELKETVKGEGDEKKIREVEELVEKRLAVSEIRFVKLPAELRDASPADLRCLDWHGHCLMWTGNDESALEVDETSETGKAVVKRFRQQGAKLKFPLNGGVYDCGLKKNLLSFALDVKPEDRDGRYHWRRLGRVTIGRESKLWLFDGWGFQCSFFDSYKVGGASDVNAFDVWLSIRVERDTDEVRLDRVCLRRMRK